MSIALLLITLSIILMNCAPSRTKDERLHLRNPLANLSCNPNTSMGLIEAELLDLLSEKMNFTYEVKVPKDVMQMGIQQNNNEWSGVFGLIQNGEADMTISYGPRTLQRDASFDTTTHVINDNAVIMIPYPTSELHPSSIVTVFPNQVWVLFAITTFSAVACIWLLGLAGPRSSESFYSLHYYVLSVMLAQGGWLRQNSTSLRLALSAWLLGLFVLNYAYTSSLISNVMRPRYAFLARSLEDLASNPQIAPIVWKESSTHDDIKVKQVKEKEIHRRLELNPDSVLQTIDNAVELVQNETQPSVVIDGDIYLHQLLKEDYDRKYRKCRAYILDNEALQIWRNSLFLPKNSEKLKLMLDKQLLLLREFGISHQLDMKHRAVCMKRCAIKQQVDKRPTSLTIHQLKGAHYALSFGCSLSLVAFAIEHLWATKLGKCSPNTK